MQIGDRVRFKPSVFTEEAAVAVERQKPKAPTVEGTVCTITVGDSRAMDLSCRRAMPR